jgi:hypothetical protein
VVFQVPKQQDYYSLLAVYLLSASSQQVPKISNRALKNLTQMPSRATRTPITLTRMGFSEKLVNNIRLEKAAQF